MYRSWHGCDINIVLDTIPIPSAIAYCQASPNITHQGKSIRRMPDLTVQMWHRGRKAGSIMSETIWVMECTFSQSDRNVTKKLHAFVQDFPGLLFVGKILLKQERLFRSPGANGSIARNLWSSKLMMFAEWTDCASAEGFSLVTMDGFTWFSLSSVEFHLWIRKPGGSKIRIDFFNKDSYGYGVSLCSNASVLTILNVLALRRSTRMLHSMRWRTLSGVALNSRRPHSLLSWMLGVWTEHYLIVWEIGCLRLAL